MAAGGVGETRKEKEKRTMNRKKKHTKENIGTERGR
jgi:hypothetical protein